MTSIEPAALGSGTAPSVGPHHNRFHLASVAFLRVRQLQLGARPRVPWDRQKAVTLALQEVLADAVSWSVLDASESA